MSRNEKTSARVAKIAAKVMAMDNNELTEWVMDTPLDVLRRDIRAFAASALAQASDKNDDIPGVKRALRTQVQRALRGELGKRPKRAKRGP